MKLHLTRDSVAAGDDIDAPHFKEVVVDENITVLDLARQIQNMKYLANIGRGEATWSVMINSAVAIIAQQWNEPKLVIPKNPTINKLVKGESCLKVHINYHCQEDPAKTLKRLRNESHPNAT